MLTPFPRTIGLLLILASPAFLLARAPKLKALTQEQKDELEPQREQDPSGYVIILATSRDFLSLKHEAQRIARDSGLPFSLRGMIYSAKLGLHVPPDDPDEMWRNSYFFRRDDPMTLPSGKESHYVSVEKSDAYPGLKKGYYIIVGGICFTPKDAKSELAVYKTAAPNAYAPKTTVYVGCMH